MPATHSLPERPNLEQLRKLARERQRETGAPLHAAQLELARYFGFRSWPRLREHVLAIEARTWSPAVALPDESDAHRLLRLTTVGYDDGPGPDTVAARRLLDSAPELPASDLAVAAVCGDVDAVPRLVAGGAVDRPLGPFGWPALMYLAYSRLDVGEAATRSVARLLLEAGADPNEGRYFLGYPTPFTLLTGVFGDGEGAQPAHPHAPALARLLLGAGADPNDGQTLYNRQFRTADDFLEILFEFGLGTGDGGPWRHRLPDLTPAPADLVRGLLAWAVTHDQRDRVALLARHGVDLTAPLPGGTQSPASAARANGHRELVHLLRSLGATDPAPDPVAEFVGAALAGDADAMAATPAEIVTSARQLRPGLIVWAATAGHGRAVELLAGAGFDVDALGRGDTAIEQPWQTALHTAVEHDDADLVTRLLALGARTDLRDARFDGTPADWARHLGHEHLLPVLGAG